MNARLTRCPACATVFRVLPEQLESRQGFVRCGQCAKVFDARASLTEERALTSAASPGEADLVPENPTEPSTAPDAVPGDAWLPSPAPARRQGSDWPFAPPALVEDAPSGVAGAVRDGASADAAPVAATAASAADAVAPADGPRASAASEPAYSLSDVASAPPSDFEFGPRHRGRSRRASIAWGLGTALLLVALAAQGVYWFRIELTAALPEVRPYLEAACRPLGCTVPPARRTALITIESSELQVDKNVPGLLTLNATLRNRAAFPQQHPSIELTLTDADDRPLSRRVLAPPEYLGERLGREPLFAAASEHPVRLHIDATAIKPTGYRLFLFHP